MIVGSNSKVARKINLTNQEKAIEESLLKGGYLKK